jgi:acetyl-CoA C-acetyltransferase
MTAARILCRLLNDLRALDKTIGLASMCVGGGMGMAMIVKRLKVERLKIVTLAVRDYGATQWAAYSGSVGEPASNAGPAFSICSLRLAIACTSPALLNASQSAAGMLRGFTGTGVRFSPSSAITTGCTIHPTSLMRVMPWCCP